MESGGDGRNRELNAGATAAGIRDNNPAVVKHHDLLNDGQTEPGALRSRGEERLEDPFTGGLGDSWSVVFNRDAAAMVRDINPPADADVRHHAGAFARVGRIPHEISKHLP